MRDVGICTRGFILSAVLASGAACSDGSSDGGAEPGHGESVPAMGLTIDAEAQSRLGIGIAPLHAATFEERVDGIAIVMDSGALVSVSSQLAAARVQARISRIALQRAQDLFEAGASVSRDVLEAAERQEAADAALVEMARATVASDFGPAAPWLDGSFAASLEALTRGSAVVVRVSFPGGLAQGVPASMTLRGLGLGLGLDGGEERWESSAIWAGPADPAVPGPVLFAYVQPAGALVSGERLAAAAQTGRSLQGVVVPAAAVVLAGGAAWCYQRVDERTFVRRPADLARPLTDGYFQSGGFEPGQQVVVAGAGLLLGAETGRAEEAD